MGQVIAIKDVTRVATGDSVFTFIDECYGKLAELPNFIVRQGQKELSYKVCQALVCGEPIAAEAPTGTGKTLGYLIGAIAANEKLRALKDFPIVVATATVGLQAQILMGDMPKLVEAGIVSPGSAVLAKGRSRYFCVQSAERLAEGGEGTKQVDFFDEAGNTEAHALVEVTEMLELWRAHAWNGDFDSYPTTQEGEGRIRVAATSDTCVGHKCEHFNSCAFFTARRAMSSAKIIVANHNLVLSDLAMAKEGIEPLFPGSKYLVVFDEAHNLPDKALEAGAAHLEFNTVLAELPRIKGFSSAWQRNAEISKLFTKQKLSGDDFEIGALANALEAAKTCTADMSVDDYTGQYRFEQGCLPSDLQEILKSAQVCVKALAEAMKDGTQALKQSKLAEKSPVLEKMQVELMYQAAGINGVLSGLLKTLNLLLSPDRGVRWVFRKEQSVSLHVSPLEGADVLKDLLWGNERVAVAMCSATLQDFDGFDRFKARSGAPDCLRTYVLSPIFPYENNQLYLVDMAYSPRQDQYVEYQKELLQLMPEFINVNEGTLILFPSRTLMRIAVPQLRRRFGPMVVCQDDMGIKNLIKTHKDRIDSGRGSLLCGLATLAEGLDLPGAYCTHVVICKVPFTVPTSPVEQELQEVMGKEYFFKRAMPDALTRLMQMVGRLMRRESDLGRITTFDNRLRYTQWGRKMLDALPAFERVNVHPGVDPSEFTEPYKSCLPKAPPQKIAA